MLKFDYNYKGHFQSWACSEDLRKKTAHISFQALDVTTDFRVQKQCESWAYGMEFT